MKAFVASALALAASTGASPAADPQLLLHSGLGYAAAAPAVAVGVVPEVALKDSGLVHHAGSGAITPDFTDAQKEANPEIAAKATQIKKYALTGNVVAGVPAVAGVSAIHHGYLYGKREAEAEADPALVYAAPAVPVVSTSGLVAHPNGAVTPDYTHAQKVAAANHFVAKGAYPYAIHHGYLYGKREAEADPEAYLAYSGVYSPYVPSIAYTGYGTHYLGKREAEAKPYWGYGGYGVPAYTYGGYGHYLGKREAEAKPYWGYGGVYGGYGVPALTTYGGYGHYLGKREAEAEAKPYWGYGGVYGGYGVPALTTYGGYGHYLGKREAEAEAKPYWGYGGVYGVPALTTYGGYGHYLGKREAEAKPYWGYGALPYGGYTTGYPAYYY